MQVVRKYAHVQIKRMYLCTHGYDQQGQIIAHPNNNKNVETWRVL